MSIDGIILVGEGCFRVGQVIFVRDGCAGPVVCGRPRADAEAGISGHVILRRMRPVRAGKHDGGGLETDIFYDVIPIGAGRQLRDKVLTTLQADIMVVASCGTL